ncbi:ABC transporter substrate-binding protein [Ampullimonas aquatilis]|uniref:ABC transporter substrate-binding protein n=1 Tax=Ampullimonas aquatilis TaxID=1341549 RepID=UPI003C784445
MTLRRNALKGILLISLGMICTRTMAEPGVTDDTIKFGMSNPLSGNSAEYGRQLKLGMDIYFQHINNAGGINGRKLEIVSLDDGYEASRTLANTKALVEEHKVFALASYYGTNNIVNTAPYLSEVHVPLVGVISGAESIREPANPYIFNTRASYHDEAVAITAQLDSLGMKNMGIIYLNNGFGRYGFSGVMTELTRLGRKPSMTAYLDPESPNIEAAAAEVEKANLQALVIAANHKPSADLIKAIHAKRHYPQIIVLSPVGADALFKEIGPDSQGVGISQVMPFPWSTSVPIVKEYQDMLKKYGKEEAPSYYTLEGFVNAKLIVDALKKLGRDITRAKYIAALEGTHDLGGFVLKYEGKNRSGTKFVEMTVVGKNGKVLR